MALVFLPAADIPRFVGEGNVDIGITGKDMVAEASTTLVYPSSQASGNVTPSLGSEEQNQQSDMTASTSSLNGSINGQTNGSVVRLSDLITELQPLGFGKCALQVQVPERSTKLQKVEDLVGKRVATSFDGLATEFFAELDERINNERTKRGEKSLGKTKIEYLGGSVEAACALGVADGIIDLVESGETMRAAGLHPIHTILTSEATLIRSARPSPEHEALIRKISSRIAGVIAANRYVMCQYNVSRDNLTRATEITPGRRAATVSPLDDPQWLAVSAMVERKTIADVMDQLTEVGAEDILIFGIVSSVDPDFRCRLTCEARTTAACDDAHMIAALHVGSSGWPRPFQHGKC